MNGFLKDNTVLSGREKKRIPSSGNRMCQSCMQEGAHLLSLMIDQSSMNLFNDYPASSVIDANESGESQITIGKYIFTAWDFFF